MVNHSSFAPDQKLNQKQEIALNFEIDASRFRIFNDVTGPCPTSLADPSKIICNQFF